MWSKVQGLFGGDERDANGKPVITLAKALKKDWLEVFYQPKFTLREKRLIGAEALIRVRHPEIGVLGPGAFLPGADEAAMLSMTERVIETVLRDWRTFASAGAPQIMLAVNIPASAFVKLPIARMVRAQRPKSPEWPGLILEVTEDQVVNNLSIAKDVALELREQKCSLAIDDFGAGYSSFARLRELPFSELKIDRAYVTDCDHDKVNAGVLASIVELAHRFGMKTVAEGIETPYESHKLQGLGCMVGQGFLFAKPMAKADFVSQVERHTGQRATESRKWWPASAA
jgi:EAL domain-containing protein (putative c-di-GMP-specific phosphodiesterase class I)